MKSLGKIQNLSPEVIREYHDAVLAISSDVPNEYWELEHFLLPLEGKWELSFCFMHNRVPRAYVIASIRDRNYHIHHFMVEKRMRGYGIGSLMLLEAEKRAVRAGLNKLSLKVLKTNQKAKEFYMKRGFIILEKNAGKDGNYLFLVRKMAGGGVVAIHQPNYVPWPGYFYKIANVDLFIFLDDVDFSKNSFINRNCIKNVQGALWLTVPVKANSKQTIAEVKPVNRIWREKHLKTLKSAYGRAQYFRSIYPWIEDILFRYSFENIADLNIYIIKEISKKLCLGYEAKFRRSADFKIKDKGDDRLIALVKAVGGSFYLSGKGGSKYQEPDKFNKAKLGFKYSSFQPPVYHQLWGEFIPNLSILDLLFNAGIEGTIAFLKCEIISEH